MPEAGWLECRWYELKMGPSPTADEHRRLLRARDAMDRDFAWPLDVPSLAAIACVSESTFIRAFKATFGETPHRYLQRRRMERAMYLLRTTDLSVTEVCMSCGFTSLGTFSRTFSEIVGVSPSSFRGRDERADTVPSCFYRTWTRPSSFGEVPTSASSVR
jgi:transcriptional regulator GlxA family with amidase domain